MAGAFVADGITLNTTAGAHAVSITPAVGDLLVVVAVYSDGTASGGSVSDNQGGTYTKVAGCVQASGVRTCEIFIRNALVSSAVSHTVTQADPPGSDSGGGLNVMRFSGFSVAGASAFVKSAKQDTQGAGTTPAPTFASAVNTNNVTVGAVVYATNGGAAATPPAGWTERRDQGYNTPATGLETVTRDSGFSGTTVTWGGTVPTAWGCVIVELTPGATAYSLDCQPGAFAVTGAAMGPLAARMLNAAPASYALTGFATTLALARMVNAQPGAFAITGAAASLLAARMLNAQPGSYALTGVQALVGRELSLNAQPGSFVLTGAQAQLPRDAVLAADPGSYLVTGVQAAILADRVLSATPGSYVVQGLSADLIYDSIAAGYVLEAEPGVFAIDGADTSFIRNLVISADPGTFVVTGRAAQLLADRFIDAQPGSVVLTGAEAMLLASRVLDAEPGAFAVEGEDVTALADRVLVALAAVFSVSGAPVTFLAGTFAEPVVTRRTIAQAGNNATRAANVGGDGIAVPTGRTSIVVRPTRTEG